MKQQSGGTILGFILGVVVGLAVALAVAIYVMKVPVQFMNKGQTRTPDQDAAETKKNKDWDPNAPLYGKNPAKPLVPAEAAASAAAVAPSTVVASPTAPKKESKPAVTADPLGDLANARSASSDPFIYFVQVGAFRTPEDAERVSAPNSHSLALKPRSRSANSPVGPYSGFARARLTSAKTPTRSRKSSMPPAWRPPWCGCSVRLWMKPF